MVDPNTRQGKRTPVTLKIKFKSETLEQFIERYAVDVSQGGIFIRTKEPLAVGTQMKFEFQLRDASPLIAGEGTVVWTRENDPTRPAIAPGMGVRFDRLADGSQSVLERILAEKAKQAPQRPLKDTTKPPLFTDSPTRVAPMPVQEALLGQESGRTGKRDSYDEKTPLPKPMPFHSDADDFGEEAFEEATKVRSLDELVAQTASTSDELAARRNLFKAETAAEPAALPPNAELKTPSTPADRDSAPGLPSPPSVAAPVAPAVVAAVAAPEVPKPAEASPAPRADGLSTGAAIVKTTLGTTAPIRSASPSISPPSTNIKDAVTVPSGIHAVTPAAIAAARTPVAARTPSESILPVHGRRPSAAPIIIGIIFAVAAIGAAVWFFILRDPEVVVPNPIVKTPGSAAIGSADIVTPGSAADPIVVTPGSAAVGSNDAVKAALFDTVIGVSGDKATIEVVGTSFKGPTPLTAQLEKDKPYKVSASAPGLITKEFEVIGGKAAVVPKLDAKKYIVTVTSDPPGAQFTFDGVLAKSPYEFKTAPKKPVRVRVAKAGYRLSDFTITPNKWNEEPTQMTYTHAAKLTVQVRVPEEVGSGNAGGSVKEPAGSATEVVPTPTPPPPPPPPPAGSDAPTE